MAVEIKVPAVGESITDGTIARWLKANGAVVKANEPVCEVETDKATTEVMAPAGGQLSIAVAEGQKVAIGAVIDRIEEGVAASSPPASPPAPAAKRDSDTRTPATKPPAASGPILSPVERPGQMWSADITYLPLPSGFMYLAATLDWYSRLVVAWRLSNTLDGAFCQEMLGAALSSGRPEVFNTDQGVQFTAVAWTSRLESAGVAVSMDGRGRCLGNVFVERLWRTVKYEDVYLQGYETVAELERGLAAYFCFYNHERPHQALGYRTPAEVHTGEGRKPSRSR